MLGIRSQLFDRKGYSKLRPICHLHALLMEQLAGIAARRSTGTECGLRHAAEAGALGHMRAGQSRLTKPRHRKQLTPGNAEAG